MAAVRRTFVVASFAYPPFAQPPGTRALEALPTRAGVPDRIAVRGVPSADRPTAPVACLSAFAGRTLITSPVPDRPGSFASGFNQ
ncbi:hypothetical protein GCM10027038_38610 [Arthrobacter bambusae]